MALSLGQDFVHFIEFSTLLQFQWWPDFHRVTSERSEKDLIEDWMDFPGGREYKTIHRSSNFVCDGEWANRLWSELWSGEPEREVSGIEVDKIPGLIVVRFTHMLIVLVLVLSLRIQQNFPEFLPGLPQT